MYQTRVSRLGQMKKADLQALANDLGVSAEGTKNDIEKEISDKLNTNPDRFAADDRFSSFFSPKKRNPPTRTTRQQSVADSSDSEAESGVNNSKHSPELDSSAEPEGEGESEFEEKREEIKEKALEMWESTKEFAEDCIDRVQEFSEKVQHKLSSLLMVNAFGLLIEFTLMMCTLVPIEQSSHEWMWPVFKMFPNFARMTDCELFVKPMTVWVVCEVALPLLASHYINFRAVKTANNGGRRKSKAKTNPNMFDPLVFALTKLVLSYLLFHEKLGPVIGVCSCLNRVMTKTIPLLHASVGDVPLITGAVGTIVSLYVATL